MTLLKTIPASRRFSGSTRTPKRPSTSTSAFSPTRAASANCATTASTTRAWCPKAASSPSPSSSTGRSSPRSTAAQRITSTDAISFVVRCDTQDEVDYYWSKLTAGGAEVACGWLKDKFGLSWQIVPARIPELIQHPKAMQAMMR